MPELRNCRTGMALGPIEGQNPSSMYLSIHHGPPRPPARPPGKAAGEVAGKAAWQGPWRGRWQGRWRMTSASSLSRRSRRQSSERAVSASNSRPTSWASSSVVGRAWSELTSMWSIIHPGPLTTFISIHPSVHLSICLFIFFSSLSVTPSPCCLLFVLFIFLLRFRLLSLSLSLSLSFSLSLSLSPVSYTHLRAHET